MKLAGLLWINIKMMRNKKTKFEIFIFSIKTDSTEDRYNVDYEVFYLFYTIRSAVELL